MNLTNEEKEIIDLLKQHGEITSFSLKEILGVKEGKGLTWKNLPNIRGKLYSHMTSYSRGMCRGGFKWISVVVWKKGEKDFQDFIKTR